MAGGRNEHGIVQGGKLCKRAPEPAEMRAGQSELCGLGGIESGGGEDLRTPVAGGEVDQSRVRGVGVLGEGRGPPAREHVLRQIEPAGAAREVGSVIRAELIERVEARELNAGDLMQAGGRDFCVKFMLRGDGALIAITEGSGERFVAGVEADVVDSPAIDGNGADAFGCEFGSAALCKFRSTQTANRLFLVRPAGSVLEKHPRAHSLADAAACRNL